MDVRIDEVRTTVDAVAGEGLLSPDVLNRIVRAVMDAIDSKASAERTTRSETDIRSVVEQQRGGGDA